MNKKIKEICELFANNKHFSGTCLVKTENEILFQGAYGFANRAFKIPNNIDTLFDTASITKTFTAAAILILVEKGLLKLSDFIVDVIDLTGTKIPSDVTIEHLLNHTSGIADDADEEAGEDYSSLFINSPNYAIRECRDFLKNFAYKDPVFKAGTNVRYNNCAFVLLGLAIEKLSGMSYRDFINEFIFKPCEMTNSKFCAMDEINENTAEGYYAIYDEFDNVLGWKKNIYSFPPIGTADGGAYTTVYDLDKFIRSIKTGKLLSKKYSDILLLPHSPFTRNSIWKRVCNVLVRNGYGFEFLEINNEIFCMYKDGGNMGVAGIYAYYPKADLTIAILANQDCNVWAMHKEIQTVIYDNYYL